ncbi:hypothetical protein [Sphingopyxis indica]|uniref:NACHT domain-containing protein n=1 Tax=Sphingopyxis indica TaxID=436663 RepID=A0A239L8M3_9SPHN|nr:hypothetical protein [Sphingopyxis indica]SNT26193.1 hypothetical protein SAMN06295955_1208 [Sphingopyxis indica]
MKRQQSTTTDNTTRSEPTPEQALTQLQAALLTLKNSGDEGFEGLAAALLGAATGMTFRLAISGTQDGQDGRGDQRDGAISFEAKLYRSKLAKSAVTYKATEIVASDDPPDLWILAATIGASSQIVTTLRAAFAKVDTSLLVLDWPANTALPPLALLCAMAPDVCSDFVARYSQTGMDSTTLDAALRTLATLPSFPANAAELRTQLSEPLLGLAAARAANRTIFEGLFTRVDDARHRFGQPLAPGAPHALAPIERARRADLDALLLASPAREIVVVAGEQGCGKSWLVAQSWRGQKDAPFLIFLTAAEAVAAMAMQPPELIARCLIEQSGGIVTSQRLDRWTQRLERWRGRAFATPQFVLVVDGLNERARTDWAPWLSSLASYAATIGGRVVATSRAKYFRRLDDRFSVPRRTITLDNLSDVELDRALVVHGIQPGQIARRVRRSLRNPRILGIAFDLLDRGQIHSAEEISIERLLFEHVRTQQSEAAQGETPWQFARLLGEHARIIRERIERQAPQDQLIFDSYEFAVAPRYDLPRDLLPVVEERFFTAVQGQPDLYTLTDEGLIYALALATIRELRTAWRNGRPVAERLAEIIEPVAALDLVTDVLFAAALLASIDSDIDPVIGAALLARHATQQNADEDSFPAYCGIVRNMPGAALDALFALALTEPHAQHRDWLIHALRRARSDVVAWPVIAERIDQWLRLYSLNPKHGLMPGESDAAKRAEGIAKNEQKIAERLSALTPCEQAIVDAKLVRDDQVNGVTLSEDAFALLAGMPLARFAEGLMCWGFARSINGGYRVPWKDFASVVQHNPIDWFETRDALLAASACFARDEASRTGQWALVSILRATGDADDGARAEVIAQALTPEWQHFEGWRLVERYCATDPCDPASERPDNIAETAERVEGLDPKGLMINRWTGENEHFIREAGPGLARFAPKPAVALHRALARDLLTRPSAVATLAIQWLGSANVLIEPDVVAAMARRAGELSHPEEPSGARDKDWVVSQYLLVAAFAHLDGEAQVEILLNLPEHGPPLLQLDQVYRPASEASVDRLVDRAIASKEEHRLLMALAFVRSSGSPLSPVTLDRIRALTDHLRPSVRGLALQISAEHPDDAQLTAFVESGWSAASLDPREDFYERWHGSSMILAAAERQYLTGAEAVARIAPERYSDAARRLGNAAVGRPLALLLQQAIAHVLEVELPFRPPRISQSGIAEADAIARFSLEDDDEDLSIDQRFARMNESDEAFALRQKAGWDRFRAFEMALNRRGAELILRDIGARAVSAIAECDGPVLQAMAQQILELPSSSLPRVANLTSRIARALSESDSDFSATLFRLCAGREAYVRITRTIGSIPLMTWDVWHSADTPAIYALRRERLRGSASDHDLALEVLAACHAGYQSFLEDFAAGEIATGHPVATARALMILGFADQSEAAQAMLDEFSNHGGMVGRAAEAARFAYQRNSWSRHWYRRLSETEGRIDFWRYGTLLGKIVDARILLWAAEPAEGSLLDRFGSSLDRGIERRIEAWKKKRENKLFGEDQPRDVYLKAAPAGFDLGAKDVYSEKLDEQE